jgi:hypothetical protein
MVNMLLQKSAAALTHWNINCTLFEHTLNEVVMKSPVVMCLLFVVLGLTSCLKSQLQGPERRSGQVSMTMDASALPADLVAQIKTLRFRFFKVENNLRTVQDGTDNNLAFDASKSEYTVTGVTIGDRELSLQVLSHTEEVLGEGTMRFYVNPGLNVINDKLRIKIRPIPERLRDLPVVLTLSIKGFNPELPVSFDSAAFKSLINDKCVSCHGADPSSAGGGLALGVDPFKSSKPTLADQKALARVIMERVEAAGGMQMPPGGDSARLSDAQRQLIRQWQSSLDAASTVDFPDNITQFFNAIQRLEMIWKVGSNAPKTVDLSKGSRADRWQTTLAQVPVDARLSYTFNMYGTGDAKITGWQNNEGMVIPANGDLTINYEIDMADPTIQIGIILE